MPVHVTNSSEPASYWEQVGELANELLAASPLREWTVRVRPRDAAAGATPAAAARWITHIDYGSKEFEVGVPVLGTDVDEASPEDVATFVVLDLLGESVAELEGHVLPLCPPAGPPAHDAPATLLYPLSPPSTPQHGGPWADQNYGQ